MEEIDERYNGDILKFEVTPIEEFDRKPGSYLGFIPEKGFVSCIYYNGSGTFYCLYDKSTIEPTFILIKQ